MKPALVLEGSCCRGLGQYSLPESPCQAWPALTRAAWTGPEGTARGPALPGTCYAPFAGRCPSGTSPAVPGAVQTPNRGQLPHTLSSQLHAGCTGMDPATRSGAGNHAAVIAPLGPTAASQGRQLPRTLHPHPCLGRPSPEPGTSLAQGCQPDRRGPRVHLGRWVCTPCSLHGRADEHSTAACGRILKQNENQ